MSDDLVRQLPHAEPIEKAIIASMVEQPARCIPAAVDSLSEDHFYSPANRLIFTHLVRAFDAHEPIDLLAFTERLRDHGHLDGAGGPAYITEVFTSEPPVAHWNYHVQKLHEKFLLRTVIQTGIDLASMGYDHTYAEGEAIPNLIETTEKALFSLSQNAGRCRPKRSIKDAVSDVIQEMTDRRERPDLTRILSTGFDVLDQEIGGLIPPDQVVIGGASASGKTALILAILEHVATHLGQPVAMFSLEMSDRDLVKRWISRIGRVPMRILRHGIPNDDHLRDMHAAADKLVRAPIDIRDASDLDLPAFRAECRLLKAQKDVKVIALDYIQLVKNESRYHNRERSLAEVSAACKAIAKELDVTVMALSQLNDDGKLRESRAIYHDSDVVLLIKSEGVKVDKQRNGPAGKVLDLDFEPEYASWIPCDQQGLI